VDLSRKRCESCQRFDPVGAGGASSGCWRRLYSTAHGLCGAATDETRRDAFSTARSRDDVAKGETRLGLTRAALGQPEEPTHGLRADGKRRWCCGCAAAQAGAVDLTMSAHGLVSLERGPARESDSCAMRLDLSGPLFRKRLAFSSQVLCGPDESKS
jgi:hypothetical protein